MQFLTHESRVEPGATGCLAVDGHHHLFSRPKAARAGDNLEDKRLCKLHQQRRSHQAGPGREPSPPEPLTLLISSFSASKSIFSW